MFHLSYFYDVHAFFCYYMCAMQPRKARPMKPLLDLFKNSAAQKTVNGPSKSWNCPTCTFLNQPGCVKCDMCFTQWVPAQNQQEIFITSPEEPRCNQRAATDHVDIEEDSQSRNQTPSTVSPSCASAAPRLAGSSRNSGHCDSSSGTNGTGRSTSSVAECDDKSDKDLALDESKQEPQVFESPAMVCYVFHRWLRIPFRFFIPLRFVP